MCASNVFLGLVIVLISAATSVNSENVNISKDSSDRSYAELVKDEIVTDISAKLEQSLQQALQNLGAKNDANFEKVLQKLDQRKEELLTTVKDTLLDETKKYLELQQQISNEQLENCIACQCRPQEKPLPTTCGEAFQLTTNPTSGIYKLYLPNTNLKPFEVFCLKDPDHGAAWTVIQRRQDNSTDFYLKWQEYQRGFGDLNTNFWIGLDRIHAMTTAQPHELWIQLATFEGDRAYAKYNSFAIANETDKYKLYDLSGYSGTAGDALYDAAGRMGFSTVDNDNDLWADKNCAEIYNGGWWYSGCAHSNLNGPYINEESHTSTSVAIIWYQWRGYFNSMKYVHMAIRPKI